MTVRLARVEPVTVWVTAFSRLLCTHFWNTAYSCKFVTSQDEKRRRHKLFDLPFRRILIRAKSKNAAIPAYCKWWDKSEQNSSNVRRDGFGSCQPKERVDESVSYSLTSDGNNTENEIAVIRYLTFGEYMTYKNFSDVDKEWAELYLKDLEENKKSPP